MFDQKQYINAYIKDNYKSIKLRIRKDETDVLDKLNEVDNVNGYILSLIRKDIRKYRYINNEVKIDFPLSKTLQSLVNEAEEADEKDDYGLYMNVVDAIDARAKKEVGYHLLSESNWQTLLSRYRM